MLVPSGNLQEWIDNQNKNLRSESDIKIEVFSHYQGTCTLQTTLTKKNLQNFNINESASVLGFETPSVNISFTMFKDGVNENLISIGSFIRISYGYLINGSWSWVEKGVYEISVAKVQNNGLTAQYQAKFLRYQALEQEWDKGGAGSPTTAWINHLYNEILKFDPYIVVPSPVGTGVLKGFGSFGSKSILGIATALFQADKECCVLRQTINAQNRYTIAFLFNQDKHPTDAPNDTYIISYSNQFKKYEIVDEDYWDDVSIWEYRAIYDESSLIKLTHSIQVKGYLAKNSNIDAQYDGYYPYNFADLSISVSSGSLGSGNTYIYGNKVVMNYPYSTVPDNGTITIAYPYVKISKQLSVGSGNSLLELDNPFVCANDSSDRVSSMSHQQLDLIRAFFNEWKNYQVHNELNVRFDPRLEIFDNIIYADTKETLRCGIVESIQMSYAGGFKAKVIVRDVGSANQPLTFTFLESTTFSIRRDNSTNQEFQYSKNNETWTSYTAKQTGYTEISVNAGDTIKLRGNLSSAYHSFVYCGRCRLSGNIMSILGNTYTISNTDCFHSFLTNATIVGIDTPYLLNATTLQSSCYYGLFGGTFEEQTTFVVKATSLPSSAFYQAFSGTTSKVVLDLKSVKVFDTSCLTGLGYDTDVYFGNEITSISSGYISHSTGGAINYYFTEYGIDDTPSFNLYNAICQYGSKSSSTNNVYTDNYKIANTAVVQAGSSGTGVLVGTIIVNAYHSDKTLWTIIDTPTITRNNDGTCVFTTDERADKYSVYERDTNNHNIVYKGDVVSPFDPATLTAYGDNATGTIYIRGIKENTNSILSSKLSVALSFWKVNSNKSYWYGAQVSPTLSLSGDILTITPYGGESKFVLYISGTTPVIYETTSTSVDLSTIPNVESGSHTIYVRGYYDANTSGGYEWDTVSQSTYTTWTKS